MYAYIQKNGIEINFNKTEYLVTGVKVQNLEVADGQEVKGTKKFKYFLKKNKFFVVFYTNETKDNRRRNKKTDYNKQ